MSKTVIQNLFKRIIKRGYNIPDILKIMSDTNDTSDTSDIEVLYFNRNIEKGIIKIFQQQKTQSELKYEVKKLRSDENYGNNINIIFVLNKSSSSIGFNDKNIEIIEMNDLEYDIMDSFSMPDDVHVFNENEKKIFLTNHQEYIKSDGSISLSIINENDSLSKYYGMKKGDICEIKMRKDRVSYRICV